MKTNLIALISLCVINFSFSQKPFLLISEISVSENGNMYKAGDLNLPLEYGKRLPQQIIYSAEGLVISASFKLTASTSNRSDLKNSSINLDVTYVTQFAGITRRKQTNYIYYLDDKKQFESSETFSIKTDKYHTKNIKLHYMGTIQE